MMLNTANQTEKATSRMFFDIPTAAALAGFSVRHFRRIVDEDEIPTMRIGRKAFILASDFQQWQSTKGVTRTA
jgi:hypothetical protein